MSQDRIKHAQERTNLGFADHYQKWFQMCLPGSYSPFDLLRMNGKQRRCQLIPGAKHQRMPVHSNLTENCLPNHPTMASGWMLVETSVHDQYIETYGIPVELLMLFNGS